MEHKRSIGVEINAPMILAFCTLCLLALVLSIVTGGWTTDAFFSVYRAPLSNPLTYLRLLGHVLGHANWQHLIGNLTLILVIGPMLEEKYGSDMIAFTIFLVAIVTGIVNMVFFPNVQLLGASGVVFAFIMMTSASSLRSGKIPITLILVALIYLGGQVYEGLFLQDQISQLTHILGGVVGIAMGYFTKG